MTDEKQQSIIQVYDPEARTEKAIAKVQEAIDSLRAQQKIINSAMVGVVIVVALGFIAIVVAVFAIFINHQDYATQKYNEYIKLVDQHNKQIKLAPEL